MFKKQIFILYLHKDLEIRFITIIFTGFWLYAQLHLELSQELFGVWNMPSDDDDGD